MEFAFPVRVAAKLNVFHGTVRRGDEAIFHSYEGIQRYLDVAQTLDIGPLDRTHLYQKSIRRLLKSRMSTLTKLRLRVVYSDDEPVVVSEADFQAENFPKLEILTLNGVMPPRSSSILAQLKELTLSDYPLPTTRLPLEYFVSMLAECTRLEKLKLSGATGLFASQNWSCSVTAELPNLASFEAQDDSENIASLLACLRTPACRYFSFTDAGRHDTSAICQSRLQYLLPPGPRALAIVPFSITNVVVYVGATEASIRGLSPDNANIGLSTPLDRHTPPWDFDRLFIDAIESLSAIFPPSAHRPAKVWLVGNLTARSPVADCDSDSDAEVEDDEIGWYHLLSHLGGVASLRLRDTARGAPPTEFVKALTPFVCPFLDQLEFTNVQHDAEFVREFAAALAAREEEGLPRLSLVEIEFTRAPTKKRATPEEEDQAEALAQEVATELGPYADEVSVTFVE